MNPSVESNDKTAHHRRRVNIEYVKTHEVQEKIVLAPGAPSWWKTKVVAKRAGLLKVAPKTRATSRSASRDVCATTQQAWLS